jgi:hypothetical protein
MIASAPHHEGTQRETSNRLEASFKSNKRESMPGDASSALEMREFEGALKAYLFHTRNHSNQILAQRNQVLALGGRGKVECSSVFLSRGWSTMSEGEEKGYLYFSLKTSRYCAQLGALDTSDPRLVLPRVPKNSASEAISVLPTQGRYYRGSG